MNQNPFLSRSVLLLTLVLMLLLPMLQSCSKCSTDHDGKDKSVFDRITEEELTKFTPSENYEMNGRSKAFELHPLREMRITAKAGAFEVDPHIKVSRLDDNTMQLLDEVTERNVESGHLLFAWDINAGLDRDDVIPGTFDVEIDMKKLGVPENLWPALRFYRTDGDELFEGVNTNIDENGVVHYAASQNTFLECVVVFAILGSRVAYTMSVLPGIGLKAQGAWEAAKKDADWWKAFDCFTVHVDDKYGNFNIIFRASLTELGDEVKLMKLSSRMKSMVATTKELYAQAEKQYKKEHPGKVPTFENDGTKACTIYRMGVDSIYNVLASKNEDLKNAEEYVPQSIRNIINGVRLSTRFIQADDGLALKPLSYEYNVYVCPSLFTGPSNAVSFTVPVYKPFIGVNNDKLVKKDDDGKLYYDKSRTDATLVTMCHEIAHLYEYSYLNFSLLRDNEFMEALGAYSEHVFTAWLKKHGYITYDPEDDYHTNLKTGLYSNESYKEALCWPLGIKYPKKVLDVDRADAGYMMSQLVRYLCENVPGGKKVTFDHMMNKYSYEKTFLQDMMDIFGIKKEHEFMKYYEGFCKLKMAEIVKQQKGYQGKVDKSNSSEAKFGRGGWDLPNSRFHSPAACVMRIGGDNRFDIEHNGTRRAYPFCAKSISIYNDEVRMSAEDLKLDKNTKLKDANPVTPCNIFAVLSPQVRNSHLFFTLLEGDDDHYTKDPCFLDVTANSNPLEAHCVFITRPGITNAKLGSDYYIDLVAFYRPALDPIIKGRSKDGTGLLIDTRLKPYDDLLEHGYVSGMKITIRNNKTKLKKTFNVTLDQCGKTIKIPYEKIDITDKEDIDVSLVSRWYYTFPSPDPSVFSVNKTYYSPPTNKVNFVRTKKVEQQSIEEKTDTTLNKSDKEDNAEEDLGGADINASFRLGQIEFNPDGYGGELFSYYEKDREEVNVFGRLVVKNGKFKLTIPAHKYPYDGGESGLGWHNLGPITLEGSCKLEKRMEDGVEVAKFTFNTDTEDYSLTPFGWEYAWVYKDPYPYYPDGIHITTYNRSYKITPVSDYHMNPFSSGYLTIKDGKLPDSFIIDCMVHYSFTVSPDDSNSSKESDMKMQIYGLFK